MRRQSLGLITTAWWIFAFGFGSLIIASCSAVRDRRDAAALRSGDCERVLAAARSIRARRRLHLLADVLRAVLAMKVRDELACALPVFAEARAIVSENKSDAVRVLEGLLDSDIRFDACFLLREGGQESVPVLIEALASPDRELVAEAVRSLAAMDAHPEVLLPHVLRLLESPDGEIRGIGAFALRDLGVQQERALKEWLRILREDPYPGVRWAAVALLGQVARETPEARAWIRAAAEEDPDAGVRELAKAILNSHQAD